MANRPLGTAAPRPEKSLAGWLVALFLTLRTIALGAPVVMAFVIVTALLSRVVESERARWLIGAGVVLAVPILARWRIAEFLDARRKRKVGALFAASRAFAPVPKWGVPSSGVFTAAWSALCVFVLAFGFADDVGRALRRHGDWFVGERNGAVARGTRGAIGALAAYLEKWDPPAELAPVVIPPDPDKIPAGPWRPGEKPPEAEPTMLAWFHPLAGPRRAMPTNETRRFGAVPPQPRPPECELGHCGVDLGHVIGEPVFAVFDGVVERIERDANADARSGRYLRISHKDGTVVSRYIHLDTIKSDLKEGDHVSGGQVIGRLGATGVFNTGPHLHFALSLRPGGRGASEHYVDPEPMLRVWQLVPADSSQLTADSRTGATRHGG